MTFDNIIIMTLTVITTETFWEFYIHEYFSMKSIKESLHGFDFAHNYTSPCLFI